MLLEYYCAIKMQKIVFVSRVILSLFLFFLLSEIPISSAGEPEDKKALDRFVSLADIDRTIVIEMRYFGSNNFVGRPIKGYQANKCLLLKEAALALSKVQKDLRGQSLSLKIYDCYRPQRAVTEFVRWAKDVNDIKMKLEYYPHEDKAQLIPKGYIASRSGHSRGDTVDLTLVEIPQKTPESFAADTQKDCTAPVSERNNDNNLDMGTGFDCFDPLSHTNNSIIGEQPLHNRMLLKQAMEKHGFRNYKKEWWHYTYKGHGEKGFYDFPVQ